MKYLLLTNAFNPKREQIEENFWAAEDNPKLSENPYNQILADWTEAAQVYGKVTHIAMDRNRGNVYLTFGLPKSALEFQQKYNLAFLDNRHIQVKFLSECAYSRS